MYTFRVYATYEVDSRLSDLKIHAIIDKLNPNLRSIDNYNVKKGGVSSTQRLPKMLT